MRKQYINHKPSEPAVTDIERIRQVADYFHTQIEESAPISRERSLALTKLEEVVMWAVKAVVLNDPDSIPQPPK